MDVYKIITERIIEQLEQGYIPWKKPWADCLGGTFNRISRKPYSLLNQMLLTKEGEYATFKQWESVGGKIKKGEKSEIVVFWKMQEVEEKTENGEVLIKNVPILRYYNVFHLSQVENVLPLEKTKRYETESIEAAEMVLNQYVDREHIKLNIGEGNEAFYRLFDDSITLPCITQFEAAQEFYSTAFHECGHSTLKKSRCDREEENKNVHFGNDDYSKEELVAEITSAAILHSLGLETPETFKNSAAYIQSWIRVLKNDRKFIVSASGKAEKATKFILNIA